MNYLAIQKFSPEDGESWSKYIDWSKLYHLKEVISLDCALCPSVLDPKSIDFNTAPVSSGPYITFIKLDWLMEKVKDIHNKQILAVWNEPPENCRDLFQDQRFEFCGYDLVEESTRISALFNCGGFDLAFSPMDLSECGLIRDYRKALGIQTLLLEYYPDEDHADCLLWAIWRLKIPTFD